MANPFLFGADPMQQPSQAGTGMADNPFLSNQQAMASPSPMVANPFMTAAAPQQMNYYQQQQPQMEAAAAANPFASFAAAAAPPPPQMSNNSPFGQPSWQQQQQQHQPHQQQLQGQFGQYTQVMAESSSQPQSTTSHNLQTTATVSQANSNPFGAMVMETAAPMPSPQPPAPVPEVKQPKSPSPPPEESVSELPPPPPDEPQPMPANENVVEERLPSPPPPEIPRTETNAQPEVQNNPFGAMMETTQVQPTTVLDPEPETPPPKSPSPPPMKSVEQSMDLVTIQEPDPPSDEDDDKKTTTNNNEEQGGNTFSGIFTSNNLDPSAGQDSLAAAVSVSDLNAEASGKIGEASAVTAAEAEKSSSDSSPDAPPPQVVSGGLGASLFGTSDEPTGTGGTGSALFANLPSLPKEEEIGQTSKGSTGDAIFADMPAVPGGTGASLFGTSEESASDTTGAKIFDMGAPREARPELGSMTGWDAAFDSKFDSVKGSGLATMPGDVYDPFGGQTMPGMMPGMMPAGVPEMTGKAAFGVEDDGFGGDDFSQQAAPQATPLISRRNGAEENPFLAMADPDEQNYEDGPLWDDDTSRPLESFPRVNENTDSGWEMFIRHPPKKKMAAQRFWKKIHVKLIMQGDTPCVQLFDTKDSKDAFQEVPLQPAYSLSDISHQVFDQYSKLFTLKLQYIFYKERAGIRPGQVTKMQKITGKLGFLAKAVEDADLKGVKEFASDMKKLGIPLEHAPQVSELLKIGSNSYDDLKSFTVAVEEKLFKMDALRDRSLTYKTEEIQLTAVDEVYVEQTKSGHVVKQLCRNRVFFLSFLSGMPDVELGVNDIKRMGLEVVGRHDILPVPTEQWIKYEAVEFHSIVDKKEFEKNDHIIKFRPPDACYFEIMRFRVRPPRARELPMQARCSFIVTGQKVEIRADMMIPYPHTKAWGQVPCEDVAMRIPIPECWIYQFRTEKAHISLGQLATGNIALGSRMGSVKSAHRRAGKVKGLERFLGTMETQAHELMETSSGEAKYEHQHKAIVWRVPRLPKLGQGSYTNHEFVCKLQLTSYDQMPDTFDKHFYVEFTQPGTTVSNTVLRSVSISGGSGEPPEKAVKYIARHEYKLEIEFTEKQINSYAVAVKLPVKEPTPPQSPTGIDPDFPEDRPADSSDSD